MPDEATTREIWREAVILAMLSMSEEDRDWVQTQICGTNGNATWVRFLDSDLLRELLGPKSAAVRE